MDKKQYVVRLYDGFDNEWIDVCEPCSKEEAQVVWDEKTDKGSHNTSFQDIDYYKVFESETVMMYSQKGRELRGE